MPGPTRLAPVPARKGRAGGSGSFDALPPKGRVDSATLLRGLDTSKFSAAGKASVAAAIAQNRPISSGAVPGIGSAIRALAGAVRANKGAIPRSAQPMGPLTKASGEVARTVSAYNPLRPAPKPGSKSQRAKVPNHGVRRRRPGKGPRREGASSSTSGPNMLLRRRARPSGA